jgi:ATP-dependent Clp protease ATP-binding subunit ClpC
MYGSESDMIRLDMSEFGEAHTVSKLVGAPPGFVGHESEGQLTGRLRSKPYSLVLLDEIEKAHSDIFNLFLQLFEDGRLTDAQGRTADGRNSIFILTSNAATELLEDHTQGMGFQSRTVTEEEGKQEVMGVLRKIFSPEFLNRIDNIVFFGHLEPDQVRAIVRMQIDQLAKLVQDQHGVTLQVEDSAVDLICEKGYVREYGARSIQRTIQRLVTEPLSRKILEGLRGAVRVRTENGEIVLEPAG